MRPADAGRHDQVDPPARHLARSPREEARPLAPAAWEALVRDPRTVVRTMDLATYRALLATPTWGLVHQLLVTTRWYDKGVEIALALLAVTDRYDEALSVAEAARARTQLFLLLLDMLDRLDEWETYLTVWHQLRRHTACTLTCHRAATRPRARPYIVRREGDHLFLHFLWLTSYRKELIERKLAAKRAGRRLGHFRHHPSDDLSDAEVRRRVAAVARWARALRREDPGPADPDPPREAATAAASTNLVPGSWRAG